MSLSIERVQSPLETQRLHELLAEYDSALPADLRHGAAMQFDAAFLARFEGEYGGCVAVSIAGQTAVLKHLYVQPHLRGKGAARALIDAVTEFAREHHCERVALDTEAQRLSAAYGLYLSLGFVACEPYGEVTYENPTFMELRLR